MKYGKFADGTVKYHGLSNPIVNADGSKTITKNAALLTAAGFMPVIDTQRPETDDGFYAAPSWAVQEGQIVRLWEVREYEPDE